MSDDQFVPDCAVIVFGADKQADIASDQVQEDFEEDREKDINSVMVLSQG